MRKPHAPSTFGFGILGRVPMAMNTVAIVFLVSDVRDSFALAGLTSAFYTLAGAVVSPRIGKLAMLWQPLACSTLLIIPRLVSLYWQQSAERPFLVSAAIPVLAGVDQ